MGGIYQKASLLIDNLGRGNGRGQLRKHQIEVWGGGDRGQVIKLQTYLDAPLCPKLHVRKSAIVVK